MKNRKSILAGALLTAAFVLQGTFIKAQTAPAPQAAADKANHAAFPQTGIRRIDLQQHDLSIPGREAIQVRVDIDAGLTAPRHAHPGEEIVYVLEGSLEYQLDGRQPVTLHAGDVLFIPAGTFHAVKNHGGGVAKELATYIVEKGKPLITIAK